MISLFSMTLILFLIMDPLGNISPFLRCLSGVDKKRRNFILARELLIALAAMISFFFLGDVLLDILAISEATASLTAGTILFLFAIRILFPAENSVRKTVQAESDPLIVPLAIPLLAGPSLLATIMIFAHVDPLAPILFFAIGIAWLGAATILFFHKQIYRLVGDNGLVALERLTGMIMVLLSIQRFLEGVELFMKQYG